MACATRRGRNLIQWCAVLLFTTVGTSAQEGPRISGRITDPAAGAVPGATVIAMPTAGGDPVRAESDAEGGYAVVLPRAGRYHVSVRGEGFAAAERVVDVTAPMTTIDWSLAVASVEEQVTVRGDTPGPPRTRTATRSDTPIKDIPLSVSSVPLATIEDQFALTLTDALRNVAGTSPQPGFGGLGSLPSIRGFQANGFLRDGFRQETFYAQLDMATVERIDVLKGAASALYGRFEPGGVVNVVTKRPLPERRQAVQFSTGSNDLYRLTADAGGPLTGTLRYRLNLVGENANSYRDFVDTEKIVVAPSLEWQPRSSTSVRFDTQFMRRDGGFDRGYIVFAGNADFARGLLDLPPNRNLGEPTDTASYRGSVSSVTLDQRLGSSWSLRAGGFLATSHLDDDFFTSGAPLMPTATTYNRRMLYARDRTRDFTVQAEIAGRVRTGTWQHQVLVGTDTTLERYRYRAERATANSPLDILEPAYGEASYGPPVIVVWEGADRYRATGFYVQDEIAVDNVRVLAGGRVDVTDGSLTTVNDGAPDTVLERTTTTFSPRAGVTYLLTPSVSVYGSISRSFRTEIFGVQLGGEMTDPSFGTQLEAGVKAELWQRRLWTTVSVYHLAKTNVVVDDPDNPGFAIQTGEQRSRGIEVEATTAWLGGVAMTASYTWNDAAVTEDTNTALIGNRIVGTAPHSGSLWISKDLPLADRLDLTVGGGLFAVGARPVNNANLFFLPAYGRADALVGVTRGSWRVALNLRNLTDTHYFDSGGSVYYPGAPRQAFVSLEWRSR